MGAGQAQPKTCQVCAVLSLLTSENGLQPRNVEIWSLSQWNSWSSGRRDPQVSLISARILSGTQRAGLSGPKNGVSSLSDPTPLGLRDVAPTIHCSRSPPPSPLSTRKILALLHGPPPTSPSVSSQSRIGFSLIWVSRVCSL